MANTYIPINLLWNVNFKIQMYTILFISSFLDSIFEKHHLFLWVSFSSVKPSSNLALPNMSFCKKPMMHDVMGKSLVYQVIKISTPKVHFIIIICYRSKS